MGGFGGSPEVSQELENVFLTRQTISMRADHARQHANIREILQPVNRRDHLIEVRIRNVVRCVSGAVAKLGYQLRDAHGLRRVPQRGIYPLLAVLARSGPNPHDACTMELFVDGIARECGQSNRLSLPQSVGSEIS